VDLGPTGGGAAPLPSSTAFALGSGGFANKATVGVAKKVDKTVRENSKVTIPMELKTKGAAYFQGEITVEFAVFGSEGKVTGALQRGNGKVGTTIQMISRNGTQAVTTSFNLMGVVNKEGVYQGTFTATEISKNAGNCSGLFKAKKVPPPSPDSDEEEKAAPKPSPSPAAAAGSSSSGGSKKKGGASDEEEEEEEERLKKAAKDAKAKAKKEEEEKAKAEAEAAAAAAEAAAASGGGEDEASAEAKRLKKEAKRLAKQKAAEEEEARLAAEAAAEAEAAAVSFEFSPAPLIFFLHFPPTHQLLCFFYCA
jgi:hypothetical protein